MLIRWTSTLLEGRSPRRGECPAQTSARGDRIRFALSCLAPVILGCGDDSPPNDCGELEHQLCQRTGECVAVGATAQGHARDACLAALKSQLVCRDPEPEEAVDFELCIDAAKSMSCDIVESAYEQDSLLQPDSCAAFLGSKIL